MKYIIYDNLIHGECLVNTSSGSTFNSINILIKITTKHVKPNFI